MKLINTNRFYLKGTGNRFVHIATVANGLREFIYLKDEQTNKCYIEETTTGHLEYIEDDSLVNDINNFLFDRNITNLKYGAFTVDK